MIAQQAIREGRDPLAAVKAYQAQAELNLQRAKAAGESADDHDHEDEEDESGMYAVRPDGTIDLQLDKSAWGLSAIAVKTLGPFQMGTLMYGINNGQQAAAVNPASVMRQFFETFLGNFTVVLLVVAVLVSVVAAVGILVSIYNSVSARKRETAILRALGATKAKILGIICLEAAAIGVIGAVLGLVAGHLLAAAGSAYTQRLIGEPIDWLPVGGEEWIYLAAIVVIATLAGLVPALKAYSTPVATNLSAE